MQQQLTDFTRPLRQHILEKGTWIMRANWIRRGPQWHEPIAEIGKAAATC